MSAARDGDADSVGIDDGPGRGRRGAERTCIVMRTAKSPAAMIRFVLAPDGAVVPDLHARLPGRGAWVTASRATVDAAVTRRQFRRAFRSERADPAPDLSDRIAKSLRADLRQAIALANKAGCVVSGFDLGEAEIEGRAGGPALRPAAAPHPARRRKLGQTLRRRFGEAISGIPVIDDLSNAELDMALGRDHVIHAALVAGAGSNGSLARWRRLRAFEGMEPVLAETGPSHAVAAGSDLHDDQKTARPCPTRDADQWNDENPQGSD